jgi:hypothetical protein
LKLADGSRGVAQILSPSEGRLVHGAKSIRDLAETAIREGRTLEDVIESAGSGDAIDVQSALAEGRILSPIDHPDPAHLLLTGTGLTHLGSAEERDRMHRKLADDEKLTDSMRMFKLGLEGGCPKDGEEGVQPEWFYKGDGSTLVSPEAPFPSPDFALDGGDEAEIAAVYLIGPDGTVHRLGYALANEFSDHVTEQTNYLYLAHSKLRPSAIGPELYVGELPADVRGTARIRRGTSVLWEKPFVSGEANMCHSLANLERHHFKYSLFRRPGDVHVHFLGAAALSFAQGVKTEEGDLFEIEAEPFFLPLRNSLGKSAGAAEVRPLYR